MKGYRIILQDLESEDLVQLNTHEDNIDDVVEYFVVACVALGFDYKVVLDAMRRREMAP